MKDESKFLVVRDAFNDYRRGDVISDKEEIEKTLKDHESRVNIVFQSVDSTSSAKRK